MVSIPGSSPGIRRLSELLKEQQEPFQLDVYLLENGHSTRILNAQPSIMCWPGGNACRRLQKMSSTGFTRRRGGFLISVLTKLVYGNATKKALDWESKSSEHGRLGVSEIGSKTHDTEPDCFSNSCIGGNEFDGGHQWRCMEMEDTKQLSPVSVLELHSGEGSPFHHSTGKEEDRSKSSFDSPQTMETSSIFQGLLEYGKTKRRLGQLDQLVLDCVKEVEERIWDSHGYLGIEMTERVIQEQIFSWGRQRGDASSITQLIESDLANSRKDWSHFQPQMREIGTEIEAAIFEEIREETVLDMLSFHCT